MIESNSSDESLSILPKQSFGLQTLRDLTEGDECPVCLIGQVWYNGLLNLVCDHCGFEQGTIHT
jgi:hypothetical protein